MKIVFAHPRQVFESYSDYRKLIEISGFETCFYDEMKLSPDTVYIVAPVNGELRSVVSRLRLQAQKEQKAQPKIIWWNLERPDSGVWPPEARNASNAVERIKEFVDNIWVSDRHYASMDSRLIYVPMGSDARLAEGEPSPIKIYDIAALTYNNHRRSKIYGNLTRWKLAPTSAWGETRARVLRSSKCMLYVHQTEMPIGAPLRFALAAAYKLPLLCETLEDPFPLMEGRDFLSCSYGDIVDRMEDWLSIGSLAFLGENLHQTLCIDTNFRKSVEEAVRRTFP